MSAIEQENKALKAVIKGIVVLCAMPFNMWFSAFVLVKLWAWFFAVPFNISFVSKAQVVGMECFVGLLILRSDLATKDREWGEIIAGWIITPAFFLLIGYIAHRIML